MASLSTAGPCLRAREKQQAGAFTGLSVGTLSVFLVRLGVPRALGKRGLKVKGSAEGTEKEMVEMESEKRGQSGHSIEPGQRNG